MSAITEIKQSCLDYGNGVIAMTLGQRIKQIRLERGETMGEFGKRLEPEVADSNVSRWERDINEPHPANLNKIAELGNTTVDELLHGKPTNDDIAMDLIDFYIEHYTKLEHNDTVRKFTALKEDIENAVAFKE